MKARTLKQVNTAIQKTNKLVYLVKEYGYFVLASDDMETSLYLSSLYKNAIYVCHLNHQSVEAWLSDVNEILEGDKYLD